VPDLGESLIAKLHEAGVTTVEALADMTPEQLEELPGVGPKTVEKISVAVNNYYSSLEGGQSAAAETAAPAETGTEADQEVAAAPSEEAKVETGAEGETVAAAEAGSETDAHEETTEQPAEQKAPSGGEDS
jgi:N utilization substance protein A